MSTLWLWVLFNLFVVAMLALDLGVFHRQSHAVTVKEATTWTVVWIALAAVFGGLLYAWRGPDVAMEFATGYLIEKALSVDNIFVFVMLFGYFKVPSHEQHRVLFWGVLGALLMRGALIGVGAALITRFQWILYVFGAFLVFTGVKMALHKDAEEVHPDQNPVVKLVRRVLPVSNQAHGDHFLVRDAGRWVATPLLLVLIMVETSDLIFALDSIPAIFAVTTDAFVVYTSNVFAILGLRSLFFLLSGVMDKFRFLKLGLAVILAFVGSRMLVLAVGIHIPILLSLGVILGVLLVSILASLLIPVRESARQ